MAEQTAPEPVDWDSLPCRERWPYAESGAYDPRCCRFPKSCSVEDEPITPAPAPEPPQTDASALLDLIEQVRADAEQWMPRGPDGPYRRTAGHLARIEAEVDRLRDEVPAFTRDSVIKPARAALEEAGIVGRRLAEGINWLADERDKALAEVERLKANARAEGEISDSYAAWAERLAHAAIERLNAPLTDEGGHEVWEVALAALTAKPAPAEPGPVVLRLGRSHADIVYRQLGEHPSSDDPRVAVFMGPDAEWLAAQYVLLANGGAR